MPQRKGFGRLLVNLAIFLMHRNRYDSMLVWLHANQREHLIPDHIRALIPHSTASTWRDIDYKKLIGNELRDTQLEAIDHFALLQEHQKLKQVLALITRVWVKVSAVICPIIHRQRAFEEFIVDEVQRLTNVLPKPQALKLARLSSSAYHARLERIKVRCGLSTMGQCFKRHSLQLSISEVQKIKALFSDPKKACWPASSLYYYGLREKGLLIAQSTFYKYVNALKLKRKFPAPIAKRHGFKTSQPNQLLHVDTTIWKATETLTLYYVFVSDNFSRAILGANLALDKSAKNVCGALQQAIQTMNHYHPDLPCTVLVSDDGNENKALRVKELIAKTPQPVITQIIAQKDIAFSNSPVEAVNRIFKRYLRHYKPTTQAAGQETLRLFLEDYGLKRPHGSLNGLTPIEAYTEPKKTLNFKAQKLEARRLRLAENRSKSCESCF